MARKRSDQTANLEQLMQRIPNEDSARWYLEKRRWNGRISCPNCGSDSVYIRRGKRAGNYDCRGCVRVFSVRTGSVFERSRVPLNKWIYAIFEFVGSDHTISSLQLADQIGVTQKTAWSMLRRLRGVLGREQDWKGPDHSRTR